MQYKVKMKEVEARELQFLSEFSQLDHVLEDLACASLDSSNLIFGIDFTKSNEWTGEHSFKRQSLHHIGNSPNPYEQAISIIGKTLAAFDEDNLIPCYGFGDSSTHDQDVFSFYPDKRRCNGFEEVLSRYREMVPNIQLAGPRSFAPIVEMATTIVDRSGGKYHILVILANGQVTRTRHGRLSPQEKKTMDAIVEASKFPLSIILVGVGDGPWDKMKELHDSMPTRAFDNFQFVNFAQIMSNNISLSRKEAAFALAAFMEIPSQYKAVVELGLLGSRKANPPKRVSLPIPSYYEHIIASLDAQTLMLQEIEAGLGATPKSVGTWSVEFQHIKPVSSDIELDMFGARYKSNPWDLYAAREVFYPKNIYFLLPLCSKDLVGNAQQEEKSLTWKTFMCYTRDSVVNIPPKYHGALLILCGSFLGYQAKNTTAPFEFGLKTSTNAPQSLVLPFGEAFEAFFPEITHITKFILCYFLTLMLVFPLQPGVQIFCMLLLISAPLFYFPELFHKASRVGVSCGSLKMPLIWFTTLGAVGISIICGLVTLLMVYLSWRFLYKGKSRVRGIEVSFDDLCEV